MSSDIFQFESSDVIGHVSSVDTTRVYVSVADNAMATRICVGGLVAIEGSSVHDFNIAVVERITRQLRVENRFDQEDKDGHVRQEKCRTIRFPRCSLARFALSKVSGEMYSNAEQIRFRKSIGTSIS